MKYVVTKTLKVKKHGSNKLNWSKLRKAKGPRTAAIYLVHVREVIQIEVRRVRKEDRYSQQEGQKDFTKNDVSDIIHVYGATGYLGQAQVEDLDELHEYVEVI
jgi:hypothetical protein